MDMPHEVIARMREEARDEKMVRMKGEIATLTRQLEVAREALRSIGACTVSMNGRIASRIEWENDGVQTLW